MVGRLNGKKQFRRRKLCHLFTRELNDLADRIGRSDLTMRLHTAVPTDGNPTNGRTSVGGGAYEAGANAVLPLIIYGDGHEWRF